MPSKALNRLCHLPVPASFYWAAGERWRQVKGACCSDLKTPHPSPAMGRWCVKALHHHHHPLTPVCALPLNPAAFAYFSIRKYSLMHFIWQSKNVWQNQFMLAYKLKPLPCSMLHLPLAPALKETFFPFQKVILSDSQRSTHRRRPHISQGYIEPKNK